MLFESLFWHVLITSENTIAEWISLSSFDKKLSFDWDFQLQKQWKWLHEMKY